MRPAWWVMVVALAGCKKSGDKPAAPPPARDAAPTEDAEVPRARPSYLEEPQPFSIYEGDLRRPVIARDAEHLYWFVAEKGLYWRALGGPDAGKVALQAARLEPFEYEGLEQLAVHEGIVYADIGDTLISMTVNNRDRRTIVAEGVVDVAADATGLYVATRDVLWRYELDGSDPQEVATPSGTIQSIAVHDGHLYWSQEYSQTIHRVAITGGKPEEYAAIATETSELAVDGKGLVYDARGALVDRPPSGPSRVRRTNDDVTSFVVDESWIYFGDYDGIAAIPRDDRDPELVTSNRLGISDLWFDAGRLVYTSLLESYATMYMAVSFAPDHPEDEAIVVSPDAYADDVVVTGGYAYYRDDGGLWRTPVSGGPPVKFLALDSDADTPTLAATDGIVYWAEGGTIRARSANGRDDEVTTRGADANPAYLIAFDRRLAIVDWGAEQGLFLAEPGASPRALWRPPRPDDVFGDVALPLGDAIVMTGPDDQLLRIGAGATSDVRELRPAPKACGVTHLARGAGAVFVLCTAGAEARDQLDRIDLTTGAITTVLEGEDVADAMTADDRWIYLAIGRLIARLPHDAKPRWQAD